MTDPLVAPFDRRAVRLHRDRAASRVGTVRPVLDRVAEALVDRLEDTTRRFSFALDLGGRGAVTPLLRARGIHTVAMDLSPAMGRLSGAPALAADEERLPFAPGSFDLVVANLSLHWVNDLPGALIQLRRSMAPDGLFLASVPALGTLGELREAILRAEAELRDGVSPRVSPFADLRDLAGLMQRAGFALPVADQETVTLSYADPLALLRDLRDSGETNAVADRERRIPPRALFPAALTGMPCEDGRTPVTLRVVTLTGWAPAPGQPRPLAPGSGRVSLAAALDEEGG